MAEIDWKKLKADAAETKAGINMDKLTNSSFLLFAGCTAILDHPTDEMPVVAPVMAQKTLDGIVEDELADAQMYADMGDKSTATDESRHALKYIRKMQDKRRDVSEYIKRLEAIQDRLRSMPDE